MKARSPDHFRNIDVVSKRCREVSNVLRNLKNTGLTKTASLFLSVGRGGEDGEKNN